MDPSFTKQLLARACEIGFDPVGVCHAESAVTFPVYASWLAENVCDKACHGMSYLVRHREARRHPEALLPGVKSLIVVGMGYAAVRHRIAGIGTTPAVSETRNLKSEFGQVAAYARGLDYHDVLQAKLRQLAETHKTLFPGEKTRIAVDTAPLLEREYAVRAGLGTIGKNTMLINERHGSRFFLGFLLSTVELAGEPLPQDAMFHAQERDSLCGSCRRCMDACPTGALATPYRLSVGKCINYWSIEYQGHDIPHEITARFGNRLFGCDTCQSVCPLNTGGIPADTPGTPTDNLASHTLREQLEIGLMSLAQIENLDETEFHRQFDGTPLKRLGLPRLKRNAAIVQAAGGCNLPTAH